MSVSHLVLLAAMMQAPAPESPAQRDARMAWWREARFGMFIHWGAYAVPAGTHQGERVAGIGEWRSEERRVGKEWGGGGTAGGRYDKAWTRNTVRMGVATGHTGS